MSGDVQPRKRKDKRKKRDEEELIPSATQHVNNSGPDEIIHIHKEGKLGGNVCSKIIFFCLLGALGVMVGLILIEFHGTNDVDSQSLEDSPWSVMLKGWVDDSPGEYDHDEHSTSEASDHSHEEDENEHAEAEEEFSEDEHESHADVIVAKRTYDDLRVAYGQRSPEESDVDMTEDLEIGNEDQDSSKIQDYGATESEPEVSETEPEEEEEEDEENEPIEDDPLGQWKSSSGPDLLEDAQTESGTEESVEEEESTGGEEEKGSQCAFTEDKGADTNEPVTKSGEDPKFGTETMETMDLVIEAASGPQDTLDNEAEQKEVSYENVDITNDADWEMRGELDEADRELDEGNPSSALSKFSALLSSSPRSPRALYGRARALDRLAEMRQSNQLLNMAIEAYQQALKAPDVPDALLLRVANHTIDRIRFRGQHLNAVPVHNQLIQRFPENVTHHVELATTYLILNRLEAARSTLQAAADRWPGEPLTAGYLGLTLKLLGRGAQAVPLLWAALRSGHPRVATDGRFYFHLGDALQRAGDNEWAVRVHEMAVEKGIFQSRYQRSLYNVDGLKAQPWWTIEETSYDRFFRKLESNWKIIKSEGLNVYNELQGYLDEAESLKDVGDWKQYELFVRGQKYKKNCAKTPVTCRLIEEEAGARGCRRGQAKFSVMEGGTHVWPHCGPTNCRLRAHLGLVVPPGPAIRVADDTRIWEEGRVLVFDDSFEHEVWHNGTARRLVLIVDVWHPELTASQRATLSAI